MIISMLFIFHEKNVTCILFEYKHIQIIDFLVSY